MAACAPFSATIQSTWTLTALVTAEGSAAHNGPLVLVESGQLRSRIGGAPKCSGTGLERCVRLLVAPCAVAEGEPGFLGRTDGAQETFTVVHHSSLKRNCEQLLRVSVHSCSLALQFETTHIVL